MRAVEIGEKFGLVDRQQITGNVAGLLRHDGLADRTGDELQIFPSRLLLLGIRARIIPALPPAGRRASGEDKGNGAVLSV